MYGLAVNLIVSVSGHPWIIDEIDIQGLNHGSFLIRESLYGGGHNVGYTHEQEISKI